MKIKKQIKYIFGTAVFLAIAAVLLTLTTYVMRPTDKDFSKASAKRESAKSAI